MADPAQTYRLTYAHPNTGDSAPRYYDPGSPFHGELYDAIASDRPHDFPAMKGYAREMVRDGVTVVARVQKRDFKGRWRTAHTVSDMPVDGPTVLVGRG